MASAMRPSTTAMQRMGCRCAQGFGSAASSRSQMMCMCGEGCAALAGKRSLSQPASMPTGTAVACALLEAAGTGAE